MSFPPNPLHPEEPQLAPELSSGLPSQPIAEPRAVPVFPKSHEDPPWTLLDVLLLVIAAGAMILFFPPAAAIFFGTSHFFGYHLSELLTSRSEQERFAYDPRVGLPVELLGYLVLLFLMVWIVRARTGERRNFFESVSWRWPTSLWPGLVVAGSAFAILIQWASAKLPIPHSLPIDKYFETTTYAYLMAAFGILVAPFMEEMFFRGFLYPALARGFETVARLFLTNPRYRRDLGISTLIFFVAEIIVLVRGMRLGYSWAALVMTFTIVAVRTLVRLRQRAFAAGMPVHADPPHPLPVQIFGISAAIFSTAAAFMLMHGAQLGFSWAALLLMFIVGLVLTLVRARLRSLAASVLIHASYNATIFVTVFADTGGFRHMERL
jgi:membrane protease YdiL (CAAX protease family)